MTITTSVPDIQFTDAGLVLPSQEAILAGVQADINSAFGGGLNPALSTAQGQLASSETAIIADKNANFAYFTNQVDPQYAEGRMQDAIARIYFLDRNPAEPTSVQCTLTGVSGTVIPVGALAQDTSGNTYLNVNSVVIGSDGTATAEFQNVLTGPIPCASGTLIQIYQSIPGWDAITNPSDGEEGNVVESRADFEFRRANSVAINAHGSLLSIYANVLNVPNVLDVYAIENDQSPTVFVGAISSMTLTISSLTAGKITLGQVLSGNGIAANTYITAFVGGSGGAGTYTVNNSQTVGSEIITIVGRVFGSTNYQLSNNSLYVAAVGGSATAIAQAIWNKKDVGASYNGNTSVTVTDTSGYNFPQPTYTVEFEIPDPLAIYFDVELVNNPALPANIVQLVQAAIIARFNGADGTVRERIGSIIYASRYYSAVSNTDPNAIVVSIEVGITSPGAQASVAVGIDQVPTLSAANILVALV